MHKIPLQSTFIVAGEEVIVNRRLRRNITIDGDNNSELGFVFVDRPENDFETHRVLNNYLVSSQLNLKLNFKAICNKIYFTF